MEKKERTKYYPINLKDKELHTEFMVLERLREDKNVDETLKHLLKFSRINSQTAEDLLSSFEKENGKFTSINTYLHHLLRIGEGLRTGEFRLAECEEKESTAL